MHGVKVRNTEWPRQAVRVVQGSYCIPPAATCMTAAEHNRSGGVGSLDTDSWCAEGSSSGDNGSESDGETGSGSDEEQSAGDVCGQEGSAKAAGFKKAAAPIPVGVDRCSVSTERQSLS